MLNLRLNLKHSLVIFLVIFSGCRLGNHSSPAPTSVAANTYKSTELFYASPSKLQTFVTFSDATYFSNLNVTVKAVPTSILQTFSNPVYYAVPIDPTKSSIFVGMDQSSSLSTKVDASGKVSSKAQSAPATFWNNPNCQSMIEVDQAGSLDRSSPETATFSDGTKASIAGHAKVTLSYYRVFSGDCAGDLQTLAACYTSGTGCTASELSAAESIFDLYAKQSGILDLTNTALVAKIIGLAYVVTFE